MSKLLPVLLLSLVLLSSCSAKPETEIIEPPELPVLEVTTPEPTPTVPLWSEEEVDVLAKMVWGEARGVPSDYLWFSGDGKHNYFRNAYKGGETWDWSLPSPYET